MKLPSGSIFEKNEKEKKKKKKDSTTIRCFNKVHISENCSSCEKYENENVVFVQSALCQDNSFLSFLRSID